MMAKKSELYSSRWVSCDSLRGGMDSLQYKGYILTLLFVKYVSDKFKGVAYGDIDVPEPTTSVPMWREVKQRLTVKHLIA